MSISILLAEKIAQLFLILLMGYLVVRVGLLKPEDSRVLSVIMVYLVMPCMILNAFQIDNTPEVRTGIVYSFVVAGIMHLLFLALTALLKKPLKLDVIERCAVIYSNASALVIPLLQATLGSEYVVYSCGFIIVQLVLLWTHCCTVLRGDKGIDLKKIVTNLNLIAIVAAALLFAAAQFFPRGAALPGGDGVIGFFIILFVQSAAVTPPSACSRSHRRAAAACSASNPASLCRV